jgi:hypothetical protein
MASADVLTVPLAAAAPNWVHKPSAGLVKGVLETRDAAGTLATGAACATLAHAVKTSEGVPMTQDRRKLDKRLFFLK